MHSIILFIILLSWFHPIFLNYSVTAFSINRNPNHDFVRIMNTYGDTQPQFLPSHYITSLPRWSISTTDWNPSNIQIKQLEGTGGGGGGFVNPTSFDQLWWPQDIQQIQVRPVLDILLKKGIPTHVMAGMQVRVVIPSESSHGSHGSRIWENYGLHSQPLAYRWTSIPMIYEMNFKIQLFLGMKKQEVTQTQEEEKHYSTTIQWISLEEYNMEPDGIQKNHDVSKAMEQLGVFLATVEMDSPLLEGLHIISLPLQDTTTTWYNLPPLVDFEQQTYQLVSIASVETQVDELLDQDESYIDITGASILRVTVSQTASGSASEYLPDVYKPLYIRSSTEKI